MKERLAIGLLTPLSMDDASSGARVLDILVRTAPELSPEFYGNFEPVKTPFQSIEESVGWWKPPFLWKRTKRVRVDGAVWFTNRGNHSAVYITVKARRPPIEQAVAFIQAAALTLSADLAYVHLMTEEETKSSRGTYDTWYPIDIGITTHDLKNGIPNVCWAMVFGPAYVRLIGREKLRTAPCFDVKDLADEHVYLQVTADVEAIQQDFQDFDDLRQRIREHLGEQFFLARHPDDSARAVPQFSDKLGATS
ncbi:MAG: hypothetical protein WBX15_06920 [Thermoanaerobaculia bacterium]